MTHRAYAGLHYVLPRHALLLSVRDTENKHFSSICDEKQKHSFNEQNEYTIAYTVDHRDKQSQFKRALHVGVTFIWDFNVVYENYLFSVVMEYRH